MLMRNRDDAGCSDANAPCSARQNRRSLSNAARRPGHVVGPLVNAVSPAMTRSNEYKETERRTTEHMARNTMRSTLTPSSDWCSAHAGVRSGARARGSGVRTQRRARAPWWTRAPRPTI